MLDNRMTEGAHSFENYESLADVTSADMFHAARVKRKAGAPGSYGGYLGGSSRSSRRASTSSSVRRAS